MIASTTGWDINPRALGIVPKEAAVAALKRFPLGRNLHYMCVPNGLSNDKLAVVLDLMSFLLGSGSSGSSTGLSAISRSYSGRPNSSITFWLSAGRHVRARP